MRWINIVMVFIVGAAFAGGEYAVHPAPPLPYVLWANQYDYELLTQALPSNGGNRTQDDFELENSGWIKGFECWFIYNGNHPQPFELTIRYDHYGRPGGTFWTAYVTDVTDGDTGDDFWEYDVWHTQLLLDEEDYVYIEAGTPYWLEIFWTGFISGYWCCGDGGNAHWNGVEYPLSVFFTVLGTPGSGVEESSWGEIKAGFTE